ncbi:MAG: 1,4-alpha-glucan branching protein GlgB [Acetobacteraceae bacterium]|nr:1,4-alpha-glucan branching protein GlgB [Acetobacteraceae bacterium]
MDWRAPQPEIEALLGGRHADPFAILGPHEAEGGVVVRALVPGASRLALRRAEGGQELELPRRRDALFEGLVPGAAMPLRYTLLAETGQGVRHFEDPYRFGPMLGPLDDHLLVEGTHTRLHQRLGAHLVCHGGTRGVRFAVWAPNAARVSVVGNHNGWDGRVHPMRLRRDSGLWEIFIPGLGEGAVYKYELLARDGRLLPLKADPFGFAAELRPSTASVVASLDFAWTDAAWMADRATADARRRPMTIYEVHAPSWKRHPDGRFWNWDELACDLIPYAREMGFTHIEFLPVMEHPLDASWGYQPVGLFAATARLGGPAGLARFIDRAHEAGIGVILDWVPAHFPQDAHGLACFDGTALFEHPDPARGFQPDWQTAVFDYGRSEVSAFLCSSALFWLETFHADGLRVDAVSSMLYLDYARGPGQWTPNEDGSNHNRDAVSFLRRLNALVAGRGDGALMIAEEASAWRGVTRPVGEGGLGFSFKWNMGWMNDTLRYVAKEPVHRRWHHQLVSFGLMYAWDEAFILPLSHDEVVHGKGTLLGRLPGDDWQRFATLRTLYACMWGHPGKKLLFMGQEVGQWREWSEAGEPDWGLLAHAPHQGMQRLVRDLNLLHRDQPALCRHDTDPGKFRWVDADDAGRSVFSWLRLGQPDEPPVAVLANFTPVPREGFRIGLPRAGRWRELLNSDAACYGGSNVGNLGSVAARDDPAFGLPASASLTLPPLACLYLAPEGSCDGLR